MSSDPKFTQDGSLYIDQASVPALRERHTRFYPAGLEFVKHFKRIIAFTFFATLRTLRGNSPFPGFGKAKLQSLFEGTTSQWLWSSCHFTEISLLGNVSEMTFNLAHTQATLLGLVPPVIQFQDFPWTECIQIGSLLSTECTSWPQFLQTTKTC